MNRYLILILSFALLVAVAVGVFFWFQKEPLPPTQVPFGTAIPNDVVGGSSAPNNRTQEAVQAAFKAKLARFDQDNTKLYETAIAGDYAIQVWRGDIMGGQAILKYSSSAGVWNVVASSGGEWSVEALVNIGVPYETAKALLIGVPHAKSPRLQ